MRRDIRMVFQQPNPFAARASPLLAVWLVTFTVLGVGGVRRPLCDGAGLEVGLCCEVKICVPSSILKSVQKYWTRESHSRHRFKSDGFWVRPGIQMEDKKILTEALRRDFWP
jgi:hypothetical protein